MSLSAMRFPEMMGLTILHSLWQITLLWIVLIAVLRLCPKVSSAVRYALAISTLILSVLITMATAVYEWQLYAPSEEIGALSKGSTQTTHIVYITIKQTLLSRVVDMLDTAVPILAWLWCAGLVVMGARFGGSFVYLKTLRSQKNIAAIPPAWEQEVKRLSTALGLRCEVAIAASARISSPLTLGSISPIILLPAALLSGLSTAQIEAILVHELYHIKRRDYVINICQALVEVLLFYHPAIWHINNIIREERENCCDDKTLAFCGDAMTYARALTQIQEINILTKPSLAMSATGPNAGNFSNRIKRLFNIYPNPAQVRSKGIVAIGFLIVYVAIVLVSVDVSTAQPVEPEKKPMKTSANEYTFNNTFSDSITVGNQLDVPGGKTAPKPKQRLPVAVEKIRSMNIQYKDTTARERSLDNCLKQVRLLLKTTLIYRHPGDSIEFSKFSVWDSVQVAGSMDHLPKTTLKLQRIRFYRTVNLSRVTRATTLALIDSTGGETTKEKPVEEFTKDVAVQVFPNATNGRLNISFTPARNNSRVKMILVDPDGKVVKEITDSTYDNLPTALQVDVSGYQKGIYILLINIDGAKSQQRVVVE